MNLLLKRFLDLRIRNIVLQEARYPHPNIMLTNIEKGCFDDLIDLEGKYYRGDITGRLGVSLTTDTKVNRYIN